MSDLAVGRILPHPRSRKKPEVQTRSYSITAATQARPGAHSKGPKSCIQCAGKPLFFSFLPPERFEARALGVETNQPPGALNVLWFDRPAAQVLIFLAVRTLGTGEPQTTSADRFGAHPKLKLPFLGGAYSIWSTASGIHPKLAT